MRSRSWSVAGRVFGIQLLALGVTGAVLFGVLVLDAQQAVTDDAARTSLAVSRTLAADPRVQDELVGPDPTAALEPLALAVMESAEVDFVTIMSPDGIRYTHPDPSKIGQPFLGTISEAQQGRTITEIYTGTLGPSVRAVVPVYREGRLVGMVSAGVTTAALGSKVLPRVPFLVGLSVFVVAIGTVAAALNRRSLARLTGRLAPSAMASMVQFYESVLHSVREGVVLTDARRRVVLYNDEAADLLGLPPAGASTEPRTPADLGIAPDVAELLSTGRRVVEETHFAEGRVLLVNQEPAGEPGRVARGARGAVMTLRDQSRLQGLLGELESVRTMSDAMTSQSHEHANLLHTVGALLEMERIPEAKALLVSSSHASQELADALQEGAGDPVLVALLLGKSATAGERGIRLDIDVDESVRWPFSRHELVSVVGNLLDNALDAAFLGDAPRVVSIRVGAGAAGAELAVTDSGPGLPEGVDVFAPGVTTKDDDARPHGLGLALVRQIVEGHGGTIRFDEHPTTAVVTVPRSRG